MWTAFLAKLINQQSPSRSFKVGEQHYDVGDDLYVRMLDSRMIYTCGYWRTATTPSRKAPVTPWAIRSWPP